MALEFRPLIGPEIDVRIASVKEKGVQILLYKDARCDMAILDETVGVGNWQRRHYECKGNLFCSVGINMNYADPAAPPLWIWKDDAGGESNVAKEKGEASDSFKRACTNWGIGRELYTSPFIWIPAGMVKIEKKGAGFVCNDSFKVEKLGLTGKRITGLAIVNQNGQRVWAQQLVNGKWQKIQQRAAQ